MEQGRLPIFPTKDRRQSLVILTLLNEVESKQTKNQLNDTIRAIEHQLSVPGVGAPEIALVNFYAMVVHYPGEFICQVCSHCSVLNVQIELNTGKSTNIVYVV
jgi:hypothetical protein